MEPDLFDTAREAAVSSLETGASAPPTFGLPDDIDTHYHGGAGAEYDTSNTTFAMRGGAPFDDTMETTSDFSYGGHYEMAESSELLRPQMRKRVPVEQHEYAEDPEAHQREWHPAEISGHNFAMSVEVRADFTPGSFMNILLIATVFLFLVALGRGIVSFIAQVFTLDINMQHLHIADVGVLVFGVFIVITMVVFFYIMDYRKTTFSHKLTVMLPYILACIFFGGGVVAMWNFTRDYGSYVDTSDLVEIIKYHDAHQWFVVGSILVMVFCIPAYYAHRYPEAETTQRYHLIPIKSLR